MSAPLIIATRASALALWQAEHVAERLRARGHAVRLKPLSTRGDELLDRSLAAIGGKGLFLKELEIALERGAADLAVHSMKDVPMALEEGFEIAAVLESDSPFDALVSPRFGALNALPFGARVGTSSLRRQAQLKALRPDLALVDVRGNVNSRLKRLDAGEYDALVLACAGLDRLGFSDRIADVLAPPHFIPAVAQGVIGIEIHARRADLRAVLKPLEHPPSARRVAAERALNLALHGSCHVPIAAHAIEAAGELTLTGVVGDPASGELVRASGRGSAADPVALGELVAAQLKASGASRILEAYEGPA
jgi:hydroxymethylbilane synthase